MMVTEFAGKTFALPVFALFLASAILCQETRANALTSRSSSLVKPLPSVTTSKTNAIADLVLIYDGGEGRTPWTVDRFRPYVYREDSGKILWLYDGFLFLDRLAKSGRRLSPITSRDDAVKSDWLDLLDH